MCVAAILTTTPTERDLDLMLEANPDGAGLAWREGPEVAWTKGLDLRNPVLLSRLIRSLPKPVLFHARYRTVGALSDALCHPFPVTPGVGLDPDGRTRGAVLIHNGHWADWRAAMTAVVTRGKRTPEGPWSDTRAIAFLIARYGERVFKLFTGQRLAVLGPTTLRRFGDWQETPDGNAYSNLYWRVAPRRVVTDSLWWTGEDLLDAQDAVDAGEPGAAVCDDLRMLPAAYQPSTYVPAKYRVREERARRKATRKAEKLAKARARADLR